MLTRMESCWRAGSKPNICLTIILSLSTVRVAGSFFVNGCRLPPDENVRLQRVTLTSSEDNVDPTLLNTPPAVGMS